MKSLILTLVIAGAFTPCYAASIDVSSADDFTLQHGDSLAFAIGIWNFASLAGNLGLSPYPDRISFQLSALPPASEASPRSARALSSLSSSRYLFGASLQSLDGAVCVPLNNGAPLGLSTGYRSSSGYTGPISVITGDTSLTPALAGAIFDDAALTPWSDGAILVIRNLGEDLDLGLPGYSLKQSFSASLSSSGGSLRLGAVTNRVLASSPTPEPASLGLMLSGAILLASVCRKRVTFSSR